LATDDVIGEIMGLIKELSENNIEISRTNQAFATKINDLEKKILTQAEQHKKDLESLKSSIDAASTDRASIKDLINLKINDTKSNLEEKVLSAKNELVYFKEDLNSLSSSNKDLKGLLISQNTTLEKLVQEKSAEATSNLKNVQEGLLKQLSDQNKLISNNKGELEAKITDLATKSTEQENILQTSIDSIVELLNKSKIEIGENIQAHASQLDQKISGEISNLKTLVQSTEEKIQNEMQNLTNMIRTNEEVSLTAFEKTEKDFTEKSDNLNNEMNIKFDQHSELLTNFSKKTESNLNNISKQMTKFFDITDNHAEVLKVFEEISGQLRQNIDQISQETKKDQEILLGSFQKIILGQAENIRNELLTFSKEIRTNLSKFNDETASKFTSIEETVKINEKIKTLDADLRVRSEAIRKQLIDTLEENVQKFNTAIKESISSVDEYRVDLERFKDDIESLVERKVNEKTEFSMELFNNLLTKTEYISKLIKDSKISALPQIAIPIPGIKNSERSEE
jgi:myosin heavy subunit